MQRYRGTEVNWYRGKVQRYKGTEVQRYRGTEVQRYRGTEVQRFRGSEVQRSRYTGTSIQPAQYNGWKYSRGEKFSDIIDSSLLGVFNDSPTRFPTNAQHTYPNFSLVSLPLLPYVEWETKTTLGYDQLLIIITV